MPLDSVMDEQGECLADVADDALVELLPQQQLVEEYKVVHDEMECWFHEHVEYHGEIGQYAESQQTIATSTQMSVVKPEKLKEYIDAQISHLNQMGVFITDASRQQLIRNLKLGAMTVEHADILYKIDIEHHCGGSLAMEMFLYRQKTLDSGNIAVCFAYFVDKTKLTSAWHWLVANHDHLKIRKWLTYKLFESIQAKGKSLLRRARSAYLA